MFFAYSTLPPSHLNYKDVVAFPSLPFPFAPLSHPSIPNT